MSHQKIMPTVSVIIPAYNEEETVGDIIQRIRKESIDWEIILVDDGSSDKTADIAESAGAKVLKHPYNIGLGGSLKNGVRASHGDILVFVDGDGQHPPEEIHRLLESMKQYDMAVGVREFSQQLRHRAFGNKVLNWVGKQLSGHKIPDLTSGFRAIHKKCFMEFIHLLPNKYSSATTLTLAMLKSGMFVDFVPISDTKIREKGKSNIKPFQDGFNIIGLIIRIVMLFNPNKFFLPAALGFLTLGFLFGIFQIFYAGGIKGTTIILLIVGILVLMFGLLADQSSNIRMSLQKPFIEDTDMDKG